MSQHFCANDEAPFGVHVTTTGDRCHWYVTGDSRWPHGRYLSGNPPLCPYCWADLSMSPSGQPLNDLFL